MELENAHLTRQMDLLPLDKLTRPVFIIGAGAIGSFTALMLAKMGVTDITVFDDDTVSIENMNCQFFRFKDIGKPKVDALRDLVEDFTDVTIKTVHGRWTPQNSPRLRGIVIAAADSMETRRDLFDFCKQDFHIDWFIDSRMGAESALLYVMSPQVPHDQSSYDKTLYQDKDAVQERCTAKSTVYTANMLSGLLVKAVKNLLVGESYPRVSMWSIKDNQLSSFARA